VQLVDGGYTGSTGGFNKDISMAAAPMIIGKRKLQRLKALGFNVAAEYSDIRMFPTCTQSGSGKSRPVPFTELVHAVRDSTLLKNIFPEPTPSLPSSSYHGNFSDLFDPAYATHVNTLFSSTDINTGLVFCGRWHTCAARHKSLACQRHDRRLRTNFWTQDSYTPMSIWDC